MSHSILALKAKARELANDGHQREGQCLYNALVLLDYGEANKIVGTELDPFYKDERIPAFLEHLTTNWQCTPTSPQ